MAWTLLSRIFFIVSKHSDIVTHTNTHSHTHVPGKYLLKRAGWGSGWGCVSAARAIIHITRHGSGLTLDSSTYTRNKLHLFTSPRKLQSCCWQQTELAPWLNSTSFFVIRSILHSYRLVQTTWKTLEMQHIGQRSLQHFKNSSKVIDL